jgi:hypothetical protein
MFSPTVLAEQTAQRRKEYDKIAPCLDNTIFLAAHLAFLILASQCVRIATIVEIWEPVIT